MSGEKKTVLNGNPERRYIDKTSFKGRNKLFKCDVTTGEVSKVKVLKEYRKNTETKAITAHFYIMPENKFFYLSTENMDKAKELFTEQFEEMAKELKEQERLKKSENEQKRNDTEDVEGVGDKQQES